MAALFVKLTAWFYTVGLQVLAHLPRFLLPVFATFMVSAAETPASAWIDSEAMPTVTVSGDAVSIEPVGQRIAVRLRLRMA